jgi:hypothetical protein
MILEQNMRRLQIRAFFFLFFLCISTISDSDPIQTPVVVMFNILIGNMMDDATSAALFSSRQPPGSEWMPQESLVYWLLPAEAPSIPETRCRHQQMSCDTPHPLQWNLVLRPTCLAETRNPEDFKQMYRRSGEEFQVSRMKNNKY